MGGAPAPSTSAVPGQSWSLRTRLIVGVSIIVALVLGLESLLEIRLFEQAADRDLRQTGLVTAEAVVDDLELRPGPWLVADVNEGLHDFARAVPAIRAISVVRLEHGTPVLLASTASGESQVTLSLAKQTLLHGDQGWHDEGGLARLALATAAPDQEPAAVVVTISMASVAQLRTRGRLVSFWLVPLAIVVLTLVLDQVLRRLVYRPIASMRHTMSRAGAGDLGARAEVRRLDEMGEVAAGLNQMLEQLGDFNQALEQRIRVVTTELDQAHARRIEDYQRMLGLREALARAERLAAVGQTAASVAHQVGTPLNLISGHVQLLLAGEALPDDLRRRLAVVQDQIGRVAAAVRGLVQRTRSHGSPSAIDLRALLGAIVDLVRPRLTALRIDLSADIDGAIPLVRGDRDELEMALLNLVSNAIDAMPGGGRLHVAAEAGEDHVSVMIGDTGSGIAPELLPTIFEPWITTKPPGQGTGLGLSITRDVVVRLGGVIRAEPVPGGGTRVIVRLPVDQNEPLPNANAADRG